MDALPRSQMGVGFLIVIASVVSPNRVVDDEMPDARQTMRAVGKRLSQTHSESELTALARRGDDLLKRLEPSERWSLARSGLSLWVPGTTNVIVAACEHHEPFWLADQGFRASSQQLHNEDGTWNLFEKTVPPGRVALGVNSLDRSSAAHYVVFLTPVSTSLADRLALEQSIVIDGVRPGRWKRSIAGTKVAPTHDVDHPFDLLPNSLSHAIIIQPSHSDRHAIALATGRVWKTHAVSRATPDQIVVSFGLDGHRELVIGWRTAASVQKTVVRLVRVGNSSLKCESDLQPDARMISGRSELVDVPNLLNDSLIRRHQAAVDKLEPDTTYRYSVGDGNMDHWSPWSSIKTAPGPAQGIRLLYMGDAQTGLERWGRLLEAAAGRHPQTDLLVLAGDLVDRGNERTNWDHFFMRAARVFPSLPLMPCVGNHEYLDMGPRLYRANFRLPSNGPPGIDPGLVYSFQAGDTFFAVLDSTLAVSDPKSARIQATWLDEQLGRSNATWKLVICHHPVYPSHPWRDTPILRDAWVPILDKHGVDLVLQGHDHAYLRTYPMRANRRADGTGLGTIYVIAVSGDKFVDQPPRDYIAVGKAGLSTYQTIETDPRGGRLTYRAWTEDGTLFDEFVLRNRGLASVRWLQLPAVHDRSQFRVPGARA